VIESLTIAGQVLFLGDYVVFDKRDQSSLWGVAAYTESSFNKQFFCEKEEEKGLDISVECTVNKILNECTSLSVDYVPFKHDKKNLGPIQIESLVFPKNDFLRVEVNGIGFDCSVIKNKKGFFNDYVEASNKGVLAVKQALPDIVARHMLMS
jgi:hypothetical protein